jgi:hypothetical protein
LASTSNLSEEDLKFTLSSTSSETESKTFVTLPAESTPPETPEIAGIGDTDLRIIGRGGGGGGGGGGGAGGEGLCEVLETFENVLVVD